MINAVQGCKGDGVLTHTDGTDMLALKRERGRDAHDLKKIDLENYRDLKVWKWMECADAQRSSSARYRRDVRNQAESGQIECG